jgi:transcriptional regulator with PAS, ATPase and Fis domain
MNKLPLQLQALIDANPTPFVMIDEHYRIVAANRAYCSAYGVRPEDMVGVKCHQVSHRSPVPCHESGESCPLRQVIDTGQSCQVLHTHYDHAGQAEHVRITGHPLPSLDGRLFVGETIERLAARHDLGCEDIRMVGRSRAFLACMDKLSRVADSEAPILLYGESGVGKELAAQFIHRGSPRKGGPFLAVNCASVPEHLFESEFFGHEKGAFTGSVAQRQGLFELADGGTLFLDEVGEIPLSMQAKLLRVLESGEFRRVGGNRNIRTDVRIVSATNKDLLAMVDRKALRLDFYYRIAGIDVTLPTLRERRSDIPALAEMFLLRIGAANRRRYRLTDEAREKLRRHDFPGNVRELRNLLQKAAAMCPGGVIGPEQLALDEHRPEMVAVAHVPLGTVAEVEAAHIGRLLKEHGGHRRKVADTLGISERTLYRKIIRYRLR